MMAVGQGNLTDGTEKFKSDSNDVVFLKMVRNENDVKDEEKAFHPDMSHQIFGESETIFGYKDLTVKLFYHGGSLLTYLSMSYTEKIPTSLGIAPDPVLPNVAEQLPEGFLSNEDEFISKLSEENNFTPMGNKIHSYSRDDADYEIYQADISVPRLKEYHERLQTFILWFIDAASYIDADDEKWNFFLLFERKKSPLMVEYNIVGYMTVYHYYAYPDKCRPRIRISLLTFHRKKSNVDITTVSKSWAWKFQSICLHDQSDQLTGSVYISSALDKGDDPHEKTMFQAVDFKVRILFVRFDTRLFPMDHSHLLETVNQYYINKADATDITVEDPSEDFVRLRDFIDCKNCMKLNEFDKEKLLHGFNDQMKNSAREKYKINKHQSRRVYEILRLRVTNCSDVNAYQDYRLDVKNRLNIPYQKQANDLKKLQKVLSAEEYNAAMIGQSRDERIQRLDEAYHQLEEEYKHVIDNLSKA